MLSVIIPARNEESAIGQTIESIISNLKVAQIEHEIIVINDGSTDHTGKIVDAFEKQGIVHVIHHPQPGGYGHSLKEGILQASYDLIAITDADGTYPHDKLPELYKVIVEEGYDMVVGARTGPEYRGTFLKMPARWVFLWLSEYATGQKIDDINSGLRIFKKEIVLKYLHTISNGFSFTTTITLAALLNGYFVKYIPINYYKRIGKSHIRYWRDSLRSLQIIIENILYYNPFKLFLLLVNMMLSISLMAFLGFLVADNPKFTLFWGTNAAFSFAAAFIIAAIGLSADLIRRIATPSRNPRRWGGVGWGGVGFTR
ncbi:glycosyl transferase family 2 [Thioploca ingrica]|uniref:Glycosyl transferase family 2 n=1 Tax=Thioploca ingrica TaxID=40754 RepID=A0A090ACE5_9GAMM|nr:glycosyl transferase family 2 [Thioploca ingrica]